MQDSSGTTASQQATTALHTQRPLLPLLHGSLGFLEYLAFQGCVTSALSSYLRQKHWALAACYHATVCASRAAAVHEHTTPAPGGLSNRVK